MCVALLMRSAVLPMAVIRKNTLFLRAASQPLYTTHSALYFFPSKASGAVVFLSQTSLLVGSVPGSSQATWK